MNKNLSIGLLLVTVCAPITAHSARPSINALQTQVNQLEATVNQLEVQLNQADAKITDLQNIPKAVVLKDANGNYIGRTNLSGGTVLTDEGYLANLSNDSGDIPEVINSLAHGTFWFETGDCSGTPIDQSLSAGQINSYSQHVFKSYSMDEKFLFQDQGVISEPKLRYIPAGIQGVVVTAYSVGSFSNCTAQVLGTPVESVSMPLPLNDPNITGISNTPYPSPLKVE